MPRATSARSKKEYTTGNNNHTGPSVAVISAPNTLEDEIRTRAYLLYEQEGRQGGRDGRGSSSQCCTGANPNPHILRNGRLLSWTRRRPHGRA